MEIIGHGPVYENRLFLKDDKDGPHYPLQMDDELWDDELWDEMTKETSIKQLDPKIRDYLRGLMTPAAPSTFTHKDLSHVNIMVKDGKLAGIIDWERSAYMPRWWEFANTLNTEGKADSEWKGLLRYNMDFHSEGARFWYICYELRNRAKMDEHAEETLEQIRAYLAVTEAWLQEV